MKIGLIVRADRSGLGYQTKALYKLLKPHKTLLIDSTKFNGRQQHYEWHKGAQISDGFMNDETLDDFVKDVDVIVTCEVPYHDRLYSLARQRGIKTVLQPNAELNPHFTQDIDKPDAFFLPSTWYEAETRALGVPTYLCPPPIDLEPKYFDVHKEPGQLTAFHIAGRSAAHGRNGTDLLHRAGRRLKDISLIIHDQKVADVENQEQMYFNNAHVMIMPRRYGGLCLPMLEALGYGFPVIMPNIPPNNSVLPPEWLMKPERAKVFYGKRRVNYYNTSPREIVHRLEYFKRMDNDTYHKQRLKARQIFDDYKMGWDKWFVHLEEVVNL